MKKQTAILLFLPLLTGCAYNEYKYGISVPGADGGRLDLKDAGRLKALVVEQHSGRKVSPQRIQWFFGGVFSSEPGKNGEFQVAGAGQGTIRALLPVGDSLRSVETQFTVTGLKPSILPKTELFSSPVEKKNIPPILPKAELVSSPVEKKNILPVLPEAGFFSSQIEKKDAPPVLPEIEFFSSQVEPSPVPRKKKVEAPLRLPEPVVEIGGEEGILKAYDLSEKGDYDGALSLLDGIKAPEWQPKVKALRLEWGGLAVDAIIEQAAQRLLDRDLSAALRQLDLLKNLPKNSSQINQERQLRKRIRELL